MWQLAYLWTLIPTAVINWVVNGLIVVGIIGVCASWIARWIPFVSAYRGPVQLVGIICLVLGVYMKGGSDVETKWRSQVEDFRAKIAVAETQSKEANQRLATELRKSTQLIKEVKDANKASIRANAVKIDSECRVSDVAIGLHNSASLNQVSNSSKGTTGTLPAAQPSVPTKSSVK
jgi:hypothetical protein